MATLHVTDKSFRIKQPQKQYEKDIIDYIHNNISFEEVLEKDDRWEIFYHLSDLRRALYNWYDFGKNASLLEIGGGFGALTGLFCEKCAQVDTIERCLYRAEAIGERYNVHNNLNIYVDDFLNLQLGKKYDYIVMTGILEKQFEGEKSYQKYIQFIKKVVELLNSEGKLLIAFDNRYGLKYFCGVKNPYTGVPFSGLNLYNFKGSKGYSWSQSEIRDILVNAGVDKYKFYYPLPDYRITQLIYTDECLPSSNVHERLVPYYENNDPILIVEKDLYKDIVENNVFPFFSNSYLIEGTKDGRFDSVIYGAITIDRGKEHGFATLVCDDQTVKKIALYTNGQKNLDEYYSNIKDIEAHEIDVVRHEMDDNGIVHMPYISAVPLSEELENILHRDVEEFKNIFDKLYEACLNSSEHVESKCNQFMKDVTERKTEDEMLSADDFGVILRNSYIDMVPFNCFLINGKLLFFDQEFRREYYPAKYTLFRALLYTYYFIPEANKMVPLEDMKQKYGLKKVWDIFNRVEQEFVDRNRNHHRYRNFYRWAEVDKNMLNKRAIALNQYTNAKLIEKHEDIEGKVRQAKEQEVGNESAYVQTNSIRKVQHIQKDILRNVLALCNKYNLKIFPIYGTLLGIVRHGDMIPWDDDIDMVMPRTDYNRLVEVAKKELSMPYYLETSDKTLSSFYGGYAKVFNCNTTEITLKNWEHNCRQGIHIDIFPLDTIDEDVRRRKRQLRCVRVCQRLLFAKCYGKETKGEKFRDISAEQWKWYSSISKMLTPQFLLKRLDKYICYANNRDSKTIGVIARYGKPDAYFGIEKYLLNETRVMNLGDIQMEVPLEAECLLRPIYGNNYLIMPPVEARKAKHRAFYDFNTSYEVYFRRFNKLFDNADKKKIVLFGCGAMAEDYISKHGKRHLPSYFIDNNKALWGTMKKGILIKAPQELLKEEPGSYRLIICNIYYSQIEKQLEEMGIRDYYIYVQNKNWMVKSLSEME